MCKEGIMSKNFLDFKFEQKQSFVQKEKETKQNNKTFSQDDLKKSYDEFSKLDNGSLSARLAQEVKKRKDEGSFDAEMLIRSVESVRAFLPDETYQNLKNLIENLK